MQRYTYKTMLLHALFTCASYPPFLLIALTLKVYKRRRGPKIEFDGAAGSDVDGGGVEFLS
jgi:hypothetical protein